ncbi:hypothetical protein EAF04_001833 [Stromatinia cepivora]|nr:hypothetical protein EAF04_001833 [Stromatinia cepivora]
MYLLAEQYMMKGSYCMFSWVLLCDNRPVSLDFANESLKYGDAPMVCDPYKTNALKVSTDGHAIYFPQFTRSKFALRGFGFESVEHLDKFRACGAVVSLSFRLKGALKNLGEINLAQEVDMVDMARFLGVSEAKIDMLLDGKSEDCEWRPPINSNFLTLMTALTMSAEAKTCQLGRQ